MTMRGAFAEVAPAAKVVGKTIEFGWLKTFRIGPVCQLLDPRATPRVRVQSFDVQIHTQTICFRQRGMRTESLRPSQHPDQSPRNRRRGDRPPHEISGLCGRLFLRWVRQCVYRQDRRSVDGQQASIG